MSRIKKVLNLLYKNFCKFNVAKNIAFVNLKFICLNR